MKNDILVLQGQRVKFSANTATVKDEDGKTRGMLRGITAFKNLPIRDQIEFLRELRRHEITNNIYRYAGSWYYLRNMRNVEQHKKYFSDADAFPAEYQNMIDEQKQVEEVSKKLLVIEYYPA